MLDHVARDLHHVARDLWKFVNNTYDLSVFFTFEYFWSTLSISECLVLQHVIGSQLLSKHLFSVSLIHTSHSFCLLFSNHVKCIPKVYQEKRSFDLFVFNSSFVFCCCSICEILWFSDILRNTCSQDSVHCSLFCFSDFSLCFTNYWPGDIY